MVRLIDADALLDFLDVGHLRPPTEICFSELMMKNIIELMPTVDAVPVIRCKDCYFYGTFQRKHSCTKYDHTVKQDGFCAWAEPKEKDNDRTDL